MIESECKLPGSQRRQFQGVWNIVRFNYEFFVVALIAVIGCSAVSLVAESPFVRNFALAVAVGTLLSSLVSLGVSWYIYDSSPLYTLSWLDPLLPSSSGAALNIHAGFDETSTLLKSRYPGFSLDVIDFYDPERHTERSIRRARKAYPPFPGTRPVVAKDLTLPKAHYQVILLILAVHEIRDPAERVAFLSQLRDALAPDGRIIIVEHARDLVNFLAYTIGFFHFLPVKQLTNDFSVAGLRIARNNRITPFLRLYSLEVS